MARTGVLIASVMAFASPSLAQLSDDGCPAGPTAPCPAAQHPHVRGARVVSQPRREPARRAVATTRSRLLQPAAVAAIAAAGVSVAAVAAVAVVTSVVATPWLARRVGLELPGPQEPDPPGVPVVPAAAWPVLAVTVLGVAVLAPLVFAGAGLGGVLVTDAALIGLLGGRAMQAITRGLDRVDTTPCRRCRPCRFGEATPAVPSPPCQRAPSPPRGGCGETRDLLRDI